MGSSDTGSEPTARSHSSGTVIAAVIGTLVFAASLVGLSVAALESTVAVGAVAIATLVAVGLLWSRAGSGDENEGAAESNVWNAIPSWQYDGRHAESGGLTRDEQESALRDIQRRADELEERERN